MYVCIYTYIYIYRLNVEHGVQWGTKSTYVYIVHFFETCEKYLDVFGSFPSLSGSFQRLGSTCEQSSKNCFWSDTLANIPERFGKLRTRLNIFYMFQKNVLSYRRFAI